MPSVKVTAAGEIYHDFFSRLYRNILQLTVCVERLSLSSDPNDGDTDGP
jgi:hypothetical protein